jgi:beta-aspartyl-peptidase (threonine type)
MIVVASSNGNVGIHEAMNVLRAEGTALDAVEAGIRLVEANPEDHSVGYAGYPNILGQVELDASIMDGRTLASGAVGAMRGYLQAISVARRVMDKLPHVLLVAQGAERFAAEMGFIPEVLLTEEVSRIREQRLLANMPVEIFQRLDAQTDLWRWVGLATDPERTRGTVNFIARDSRGDIASGVSTSGWAWKYPGRLGDSPVIGAGNYADNRYGAAACTGMGEMAIRASTAHSIVFYIKMGHSVEEAGRLAMADLQDLGGRYVSVMNAIAIDREGNHAGFTTSPDRTYIYQTDDMDEAVEIKRIYAPLSSRWGSEARD